VATPINGRQADFIAHHPHYCGRRAAGGARLRAADRARFVLRSPFFEIQRESDSQEG